MANMIEYKKNSDIFMAPNNDVLVHSCNAKGKWGSGIAASFRKYFPNAYGRYVEYCENHRFCFTGHGFLAFDGDRPVGCLVVSKGYGKDVDTPEEILDSTRLAVTMLLDSVPNGTTLHSPKINSGLFCVEWYKTEKVINEALFRCNKNIRWIVYEV